MLDNAKAWIGSHYDAAKARANVALAAKKLLEEGGPPQEKKVIAKSDAASAVSAHAGLMAQLADVVAQYEAAAVKLGETEAMGATLSAEEKAEFLALADDYKKVAVSLQQAQLLFPGVDQVRTPTTSPVEEDAAVILYLQHKAQDAKQHAVSVVYNAMDEYKHKARGKAPESAAAAAAEADTPEVSVTGLSLGGTS
mmetsp:Transcript_36139/g.84432  ORF Transcript_36139/g.84432 Transcript_36139/m.84432 type:complete len:196 (-) Transcript_36139:323-910(-)|eukprot:CAMPEP_0119357662 /NCGR_PEP_ID=MMETSP1334-20130426/6014_1 /TAXON_ID=127549 /ORGANISM="Calcidiscus leptoporus, Strain RCC1130" /LENGTH=195 /DNA_ID=CAMNT_0007371961 /DNA_START=23 /DNA_END=610 /DNA_ORIENTATION=+